MTSLDQVCRRRSAIERLLASLPDLDQAELEQLADQAEQLLEARRVAGGRCAWTGRCVYGRVRCELAAGHPGDHVFTAAGAADHRDRRP